MFMTQEKKLFECLMTILKTRNIRDLKQETGLKILTPKQMVQRLPIALAQIKEGNNIS